MLRPRTPLLSLLLLGLVLSPCGCTSSESPTEPDTRPALHLVGLNASSSSIWLDKSVADPVPYKAYSPVEVRPGSSVELTRWQFSKWVRASFGVYRPSTSGPVPFSPWALVQYNLDLPTGALTSDLTVTVRLAIEPTGSLSVTSDRPDIFQVAQISYAGVQ